MMLIAEGNYIYRLNGEDARVTESWSIHQDSAGKIITSSVRDARPYKSRIEVHAVTQAGVITTFAVRWHSSIDDRVAQAEATYQIEKNTVSLRRIINGKDEVYRFEYASMPIVSPLMRVFTGEVIVKLSDLNVPSDVLIPDITDPSDDTRLLMPIIEQRHARLLHTEDLKLAGQVIATDCYNYISDQYDEDTRFWIDTHHLMVRYTWKQWDVVLDRYERPS